MVKVELIYHTGCPNLSKARDLLEQAFSDLGVNRKWLEWNSDESSAPEYARLHASPTILINGEDLCKVDSSADTRSCRIYLRPDGSMAGLPTLEMIKVKLQETK